MQSFGGNILTRVPLWHGTILPLHKVKPSEDAKQGYPIVLDTKVKYLLGYMMMRK